MVRRNVAAFFNEAWAYGFLPAGARLGGARCALLDVAPRLHADGPWANDCRCRLSRERRVGAGRMGRRAMLCENANAVWIRRTRCQTSSLEAAARAARRGATCAAGGSRVPCHASDIWGWAQRRGPRHLRVISSSGCCTRHACPLPQVSSKSLCSLCQRWNSVPPFRHNKNWVLAPPGERPGAARSPEHWQLQLGPGGTGLQSWPAAGGCTACLCAQNCFRLAPAPF